MLNYAFYIGHFVSLVYYYTGLTIPLMNTKRYIDFRPGDVFILAYVTATCIFLLMPIYLVFWLAGLVSLSWFVAGSFLLFFSPPFLTIILFEIVMFFNINTD